MDEKIVKICEKNLKNKFNETIKTLNEKGFNIKKGEINLPELSFNLRGHVAGKAYSLKNLIKLNRDIISNPKHFKDISEDTLYHELAHIFTSFLYRTGRFRKTNAISYGTTARPKSHGREWQEVMRIMGQKPERTHNYETTTVRAVTRITYICNCMEHEITSMKHKKIQNGAMYTCRSCRGFLELKPGAELTKK